jgi:hypothetical protein
MDIPKAFAHLFNIAMFDSVNAPTPRLPELAECQSNPTMIGLSDFMISSDEMA